MVFSKSLTLRQRRDRATISTMEKVKNSRACFYSFQFLDWGKLSMFKSQQQCYGGGFWKHSRGGSTTVSPPRPPLPCRIRQMSCCCGTLEFKISLKPPGKDLDDKLWLIPITLCYQHIATTHPVPLPQDRQLYTCSYSRLDTAYRRQSGK